MAARRRHGEDGQILVLVLAALVALGLLAGALTGLATPSFTHATVVRTLNDTVSAADSGIEYAMQFIRDDPAQCVAQAPGDPPLSMPTQTFNNRTVKVTCAKALPDPSPSTSYIDLDSTAQIAGGNPIEAKATIEVNKFTGYPTVDSWRTCRNGEC
jgi:hypothetical protein